MINQYKRAYFLFSFVVGMGLLGAFNVYAQEDTRALEEMRKTEQELDQLLDGMDSMNAEVERTVQQIEKDLKKEEQNETRNKNRVLWSIPAAFPEDKFGENIKDLHVNIPFYGKVSLGNGQYDAYHQYKEWIDSNKDKEMKDFEEWSGKGLNIRKDFQDFLSQQENLVTKGGNEFLQKTFNTAPVYNTYAPGLEFYEYLTGRRLVGVGLYRSDINQMAFLAANMVTGYLLFQDIKKAKFDAVKAVINTHKSELIRLIENLKKDTNTAVDPKVKKEIESFIVRKSALFGYNPLKKEIILPILKYIAFQRIIENIKMEKPSDWAFNPDAQDAFVKNEKGEYVRSGVTPISAVTLSKYFVAPMAGLSETTSETLQNASRSLRFGDRFFGRIHLPLIFYRWFASIGGEALVLMIAIKIMDGYFNEQLLKAITSNSEQWLSLLKEAQQRDTIEQLSPEQLLQHQKFEKEIEQVLTGGKTGFWGWIEAQRSTFAKISLAGLAFVIVPSLVVKMAPWAMKMIKSYGGIA